MVRKPQEPLLGAFSFAPSDFKTMQNTPLVEELQLSEPLLSLYRARQYIVDPDVLECLDSLIILTTKRIIRGKLASMPIAPKKPDKEWEAQ